MDSLIKGYEITKKEIPMQSSLVAPLVYYIFRRYFLLWNDWLTLGRNIYVCRK